MPRKYFNAFQYVIFAILLLFAGCNKYEVPVLPETLIDDESPSWSPDGKWIVYTHFTSNIDDEEYPSGLYLMNTVSGEKRYLTYYGISPAWSPDSKSVIYVGEDKRLRIINIDTYNISLLEVNAWCYSPSWSKENLIAFGSGLDQPNGLPAIWLMEANGDSLVNISDNTHGEWNRPDWSPDGNSIVHIRSNNVEHPNNSEIYIMNKFGGDSKRLTYNNIFDYGPKFSPDGSKIAWWAWTPGIIENNICIMNSDGTGVKVLCVGDNPSWSPDGENLVFNARNGNKIVLFKINIEKGEIIQITE